MKMIPPRVLELRRELESKKFKGTKRFMERMADEHRKIVGVVPTSCKVNINGTPFLTGFERMVIGAHGPYIEFDEECHCLIPLIIKEDCRWRLSAEYQDEHQLHPKYLWLYPQGFPEIKVYKQIYPVSYASYIVGMFYVDFWAVDLKNNSKEELDGRI